MVVGFARIPHRSGILANSTTGKFSSAGRLGANHGRGRSRKGLYRDKQALEELTTGLIESAGIECSVFFCNLHVQIVRRWE